STLTGTVTGITGGNFEAVDYSSATATAKISDTINTTTISLSATDIDKAEAYVTYTVTLSNAGQTDAVVTVNVGGTDYPVNIVAGATSSIVNMSNPYKNDHSVSTLTGTVTGITGGNFEAVDYSSATATAKISDTIVSLFATDISEGEAYVSYTVTLSYAAQTDAVVTVNVGGTDYTINIAAGATSGTVDVPNPNGEDPYIDESRLTGTVTGVTGGNFEAVDYRGATATATIRDTIDTTKISLSASDISEGDAYVTYTVTLSNAAQTDAMVTVNVGGTDYNVNIAAGSTSGTVNAHKPFNASTLTGTVTGMTGGNFEAVDYSGATATAT
ncbi:MAG: immunoglobulin-like domain-containing protein, partial [Lachnospiraceae bacterium]|nr:immunoglobulin-like domain-containing protein [Lachnospiraceae bacterium]